MQRHTTIGWQMLKQTDVRDGTSAVFANVAPQSPSTEYGIRQIVNFK